MSDRTELELEIAALIEAAKGRYNPAQVALASFVVEHADYFLAALAPRAVMDDAAVEWLRKHIAEVDDDNAYWGGPHKREYLTAPEILERIATLSRVPAAAWPGEDELSDMAFAAFDDAPTYRPVTESIQDYAQRLCFEMARRLKAHMTGGAAKPEPEWFDWHGGECPVPAGTRVEVEFADGVRNRLAFPHMYRWEDFCPTQSIRRYRILGGAA